MRTSAGSGAVVLVVDDDVEITVGALEPGHADLAVVDALARLQLAARRRGWAIWVRNPPAELLEVLELVGLRGVFAAPGSGFQVGGEPEGGEELGVQEVVQRGDASA
ncbi:MAG: hypothetical protein ABIV94_07815 [Acidimicrobiales bacterium]